MIQTRSVIDPGSRTNKRLDQDSLTVSDAHDRSGETYSGSEARIMNSVDSMRRVLTGRFEALSKVKVSKELIASSGLGKMLGKMCKPPQQEQACSSRSTSSVADDDGRGRDTIDRTCMIPGTVTCVSVNDKTGLTSGGLDNYGYWVETWQAVSSGSYSDFMRSQLLMNMRDAASCVVLAWKACLLGKN
jgi:hypothetical protein